MRLILLGGPGVGKGTTGAWMCRELQALGMRPVVYDAEQRERAIVIRAHLLGHRARFGNREADLLLHGHLRLGARLLGRRCAGRNRGLGSGVAVGHYLGKGHCARRLAF